jgi:hypothetical protein
VIVDDAGRIWTVAVAPRPQHLDARDALMANLVRLTIECYCDVLQPA